jgi:8-oxo-dGTP pyrophosphatase MutT (NUDIX family)
MGTADRRWSRLDAADAGGLDIADARCLAAVSDRAPWARALQQFGRNAAVPAGKRPAAVAIAVLAGPGGPPCFLLTRRSAHLRNHPGQYALPGGLLATGESAPDAARRELAEEVGVSSSAGDVLGALDDYVTRSGFVITPVVLWLADRPHAIVPQPSEVARVYLVPVADLDAEPVFAATPDPASPLIRLPLLGGFIHAPTGAILYQFAELVLRGRTSRVAHYAQPRFTWS